jgi:hypothetical protein
MLFPEAETGLILTIEGRDEEILERKDARCPAASQVGSTTFQRLTRTVNNLQIISTT